MDADTKLLCLSKQADRFRGVRSHLEQMERTDRQYQEHKRADGVGKCIRIVTMEINSILDEMEAIQCGNS